MPEINLLKQNTSSGSFSDSAPKIFAWVLLLVLICLVGFYVWLYFQSKSIEEQAKTLQQSMANKKKEALEMEERDELLTRQAQLKALTGLVGGHVYWSQLLPEIAEVTLKTASYASLTAGGADGRISLETTVPSLVDLDKFMQVFDLPQFNKNFNDIRIGGFNKAQTKDGSSIKFRVDMKYNPQIIQY